MRAHLSIALACALYLLIGLVTGNVLATGQAEPLRWLSASIYFAATLAFFLRPISSTPHDHKTVRAELVEAPYCLEEEAEPFDRLRANGNYASASLRFFRQADFLNHIIAAFLSGLAVLFFCGVAGRYWNIGHAALLGLINFALLVLFGQLFRWKRGASLLLGLALLGGLLLPARIYFWPLERSAAIQRGTDNGLTIMSSLPIGPFGEHNVAAALEKPMEPIFSQLSRTFDIAFADSFEKPPQHRLLLAHPRALHPADLVALDHWIRGGGEALILADPLLAWPSALSPADARRPPVTSLLDPLLAHWGLHLEPARRTEGIVQRRLANGRLLAMIAPGHFTLSGKACRLEEQGLIAHCRLGRGGALLLADADMLHPALWMGGDGSWPAIDRDRLSDNMLLIGQWLGRREQDVLPRIGWILTNRDICYGLAAGAAAILLLSLSLLAWASLGTGRGNGGTRREN